MITYPVIFFGNLGGNKIKEDFDDYADGSLPVYPQIWQYHAHQWLTENNPSKFNGFTWKDYGISGAYDEFDNYNVGNLILNFGNLHGLGNFDINSWTGFSAGYYRDRNGYYTSADQLRGYGFVWFDWGSNAPLPGYKADFWGTKFIGNFIIKTSGDYTFYVERDEWARIYVGRENGPNQLIFDKWGVTPPSFGDEATSPINFSPGITTMLIHFYEDIGNAKLKLSWSGPDFGKRPMLPSDFGNSGYVREYVPTHGGTDRGWNVLGAEGAYRLGIPEIPYANEKVRQDYSISGNYSLGVVKIGTLSDYGFNKLSPQGLYTVAYNYSVGNDKARLNVNPGGLYYYKYQPVVYNEKVSNDMDAAGHYAFKNEFVYANEKVRELMNFAGFHITGRTNTDLNKDVAINTIQSNGFYAYPFVHTDTLKDYSYNKLSPVGNYFPIWVYAPYSERAQNLVDFAGYHFTGYINNLAGSKAWNDVRANGHYAYGIVTGDIKNDKGFTQVNPHGFYAYQFVNNLTNEKVLENVELGGLYLPRYEYLRYRDAVNHLISPDGGYYSRFLPQRFGDKSRNEINPQGYYASGAFHLPTRDIGYGTISHAGHYATGYIPLTYREQAENILNSNGNYFYAILSNYNADKAKSDMGIEGYYRSIYAYFKYSDKAQELIRIEGNYFFRYSHTRQGDKSYNQLDPRGFYADATVKPYGNDETFNVLNSAGNYFFRYVSGATNEKVREDIKIDGNYFFRYHPSYCKDFAYLNCGVEGTYLYKFPTAEAADKEKAYLILDAAGRYDARYSIFRGVDKSYDLLALGGNYYSIHLEASWGDKACDLLNFSGEYFYGRVPVNSKDQGYNYLGISDGRYFSRYVPFYANSKSINLVSLAGDYTRESYVIVDSGVLSVDFESEFVSFHEAQDLGRMSAEFSGNYIAMASASTLEYWLEIYRRSSYNMSKSQQYFAI